MFLSFSRNEYICNFFFFWVFFEFWEVLGYDFWIILFFVRSWLILEFYVYRCRGFDLNSLYLVAFGRGGYFLMKDGWIYFDKGIKGFFRKEKRFVSSRCFWFVYYFSVFGRLIVLFFFIVFFISFARWFRCFLFSLFMYFCVFYAWIEL